ncbi:MAG TPA: SDR family oxidoreductase [Patescibacteria group bacterium]|nr:SDR family oxidoreductase [Patescibacteria group bacterium]
MADDRERWALILGASSGMGEATGIALARAGYRIFGIHLDSRAGLPHVEEVKAAIEAAGSEALFLNMNAASEEKRAEAISRLAERFEVSRAAGRQPHLRVVMHSLAFGTLLPFLAKSPADAISRRQLEMTLDVMANSLVYWVQDLWRAGLLGQGSKVFAMTSEGSNRMIPSYGAVSAAKVALESHCRQLAMELAHHGAGVAVNAIRAGVTDTPALRKIPGAARLIEITLNRNPNRRLTSVEDVADAVVTLAATDSDWISGNVINVDGAEFITANVDGEGHDTG